MSTRSVASSDGECAEGDAAALGHEQAACCGLVGLVGGERDGPGDGAGTDLLDPGGRGLGDGVVRGEPGEQGAAELVRLVLQGNAAGFLGGGNGDLVLGPGVVAGAGPGALAAAGETGDLNGAELAGADGGSSHAGAP